MDAWKDEIGAESMTDQELAHAIDLLSEAESDLSEATFVPRSTSSNAASTRSACCCRLSILTELTTALRGPDK